MLENIGTYLVSIALEGVLFAVIFWVLMFLTVERTSMIGAVRAALVAEAVGNLAYLAGEGGMSPPSLLLTLVSVGIFLRMILRVGELSLGKAAYGTSMTYFILVALVTCQ